MHIISQLIFKLTRGQFFMPRKEAANKKQAKLKSFKKNLREAADKLFDNVVSSGYMLIALMSDLPQVRQRQV